MQYLAANQVLPWQLPTNFSKLGLPFNPLEIALKRNWYSENKRMPKAVRPSSTVVQKRPPDERGKGQTSIRRRNSLMKKLFYFLTFFPASSLPAEGHKMVSLQPLSPLYIPEKRSQRKASEWGSRMSMLSFLFLLLQRAFPLIVLN